ncbi:MAG: hypothetical protein JXR56_06395 [Candidatus Cloacimonetes bacterium]|nr:hypothetical protein [Candidatus Cloacimonadota bacterium]
MKLDNLKQYPFNTTLMGTIKGIFQYYGYQYSDAFIFGGTGHAFLINIHEQLCPSSPYCWNSTGFVNLMKNMGVEQIDLGFFMQKSSLIARKEIQDKIKSLLKKGVPCSLLNMENQLVYGFNEEVLLTSQPWECSPEFPPKTLTYDDWTELNGEIHLNFYSYTKTSPAPVKQIVKESLEYAVELNRFPKKFASGSYGIGPLAYENFLKAVEKYGDSHGNWWNATVWSENRLMAAQYLKECAEMFDQEVADTCLKASGIYSEIGILLNKISDKALPVTEKTAFLHQAATLEKEAIALLSRIIALI